MFHFLEGKENTFLILICIAYVDNNFYAFHVNFKVRVGHSFIIDFNNFNFCFEKFILKK